MFARPAPRQNEALKSQCRYFLSGDLPQSPADQLRELADYAQRTGFDLDRYGQGEALQAFERQVAEQLGKPAAIFLPTGVLAQLIAVRIHADETGRRTIALHPTSHLELNEELAYRHLHALEAELIGPTDRPYHAHDLRRSQRAHAAALIELPYRRLGGVLPPWDELQDTLRAIRERGSRAHLDGARLWEAQAGYARPFAEICAGFDSVYVSFYKGLGGLTGCMLLGEIDFIAQARVWARRHGGNPFTLLPYVVSAKQRLDERLPRMPEYLRKARELAAALGDARIPGVEVHPGVPDTAMMHVRIARSADQLYDWRDRVARGQGLWLGGYFGPSSEPGVSVLEIAVGEATLEVEASRLLRAFGDDLSRPA